MPTNMEHATAAPRSVVISGTEYMVSPLSVREWGEYFAWMRDAYLRLMRTHAAQIDNALDRRHMLDRSFDRAAQLTVTSQEFQALRASPQGVIRLVWLHLRKRHPDMTEERVTDLMEEENERNDLLDAINATMPADKGGPAGFPKAGRLPTG